MILIALAFVYTGAWIGYVLITRDRISLGAAVFLLAVFMAALVTDNMR